MIKYAKVINEENGLCEIGDGTNIESYQSIGMVEMNVDKSEIDGNWYLYDKCPHYTEVEKAAMREADFNKSFFQTSLGYVRRLVTMADGSHKDFLSDLLPAIAASVQAGKSVNILTYDKPPFTEDVTDWTKYQHQVTVTAQFIQECFMQLSNDFLPINEE